MVQLRKRVHEFGAGRDFKGHLVQYPHFTMRKSRPGWEGDFPQVVGGRARPVL